MDKMRISGDEESRKLGLEAEGEQGALRSVHTPRLMERIVVVESTKSTVVFYSARGGVWSVRWGLEWSDGRWAEAHRAIAKRSRALRSLVTRSGRHRVKMARLRIRKCVMRFSQRNVQDNDGAVK